MAELEDSDFQSSDEENDDPTAPVLPKGVRKVIIDATPVEGSERPIFGDEVTIHVVMRVIDGTAVWSTREEGTPFTVVVGQWPRETIEGLEIAALSMYKGEVSRFTITPRFGYGVFENPQRPAGVPLKGNVICDVELLSFKPCISKKVDLFNDGCAVKSIVERGEGKVFPKRGQDLLISVKATARDGQILSEHVDLAYRIGDDCCGSITRVVAEGILNMTEGEKATVPMRRFGIDDAIVDREHAAGTLELELKRMFEFADVSPQKNGSLMKKVLIRGEGKVRPIDTSNVTVTLTAATNGVETLPGFTGARDVDFCVGEGSVIDALEFAVLDMVAGETAVLTCTEPMSYCHDERLGLQCSGASTVVLTVELKHLEPCFVAAELPLAERIAFAQARKDKGGELFQQSRFRLALDRYDKVLALFNADENDPAVAELRLLCELNRAACLLKVGDPTGAIAACNNVLDVDPDQIKALFRRGSARFQMSNYSGALSDMNEVLQKDPRNVDARNMVVQIRAAKKQYSQKEKTTAAKMVIGQEAVPQSVAAKSRISTLLSCLPLPCLA